jgi:hypothetical protein
LRQRFDQFGDLEDIDASISVLRKSVDTNHGNECNLNNLGLAYISHFQHLGELADMEASISNLRKALKLTSNGILGRAESLGNLGACYA